MLINRLEERASAAPEDTVITWVDDSGKDAEALSAKRLLERAKTLSGFLRGPCGLACGDRALLVYPPSLPFIEAFIACLYAGVIPVPCYPPDPRSRGQVARIGALAKEAGARVALTSAKFRWAQRLASVSTLLSTDRPSWTELSWKVTDEVKTGSFPARRHPATADEIAFVQYTSGSTSAPRGVALTFRNLEHQLMLNARALRLHPTSRAVIWVPQYHDLGLVSGICSAVHGNGHLYMMSPLAFLSRPAIWAEVMTRVQATHTASPHFGYMLLLRKTTPEQRALFDLSHLQVLMSAGEPISHQGMQKFCAAFGASGLRSEAFFPAYGLAEHTVGVTMGGRQVVRADRITLEKYGEYRPAAENAPAHAVTTLVGCGKAESDVVVRIVSPDRHHALPDGLVGEIWVDSLSKASAYFGRPEETAALLQARIDGAKGDVTYLRTGDLGFVHDGELFVTGRLKDLIIVAGRNLSAIDVEEAVRVASTQVRPGGIVAIAVPDARGDTEAVGLVLESVQANLDEPTARAIAEAARGAVLEQLRIGVTVVVVGASGLVPKTTSGKLQRRACQQAFRNGSLEQQAEFRYRFDFDAAHAPVSAAVDPQVALHGLPARLRALPLHERHDAMVAALQAAVARALGSAEPHAFNPHDSLTSFGLDSITLVELADELSSLVETPLTLALIAALPNLSSLAAFLLREVLHLEFVETDARDSGIEQRSSHLHIKAWQPRPGSRIAIVGAGCAGLTAAMELAHRGYRSVTIFEALPRVGGKVFTASQDGIDFEMGQLLFGQRYRTIWRLAVDVGCEFTSEPRTDYLQSESGERSELRTTQAIKSWYEALFAAAGVSSTLPPEASVEAVPEDLLMPAGAWLARHGLAPPPAAFLTSWTGCGYGYLGDDVPAWYLLRYLRIIHSANVLPLSIKGGNQSIWQRAAARLRDLHGFELRLGTAVSGYDADGAGVSLTVANESTERFDAVLFALPPQALASLLRPDLGRLFARFRHYGYRAAAFEADGLPPHIRSIHFAEAERAPHPGRVLGISRAHSAPRSFIAGQYIFGPGQAALSDAELDAQLDAELVRLELRVTERRGSARWLNYFPHLSAADLRSGTLQDIEARQGKNRTFYLGSYLAFETLEHVARHAQSIVATFFCGS